MAMLEVRAPLDRQIQAPVHGISTCINLQYLAKYGVVYCFLVLFSYQSGFDEHVPGIIRPFRFHGEQENYKKIPELPEELAPMLRVTGEIAEIEA